MLLGREDLRSVALINQADEARDLARAICEDIASYAGSFVAAGTDISPQVQEGRALYSSRVVPELGLIFDEALLEVKNAINLRALSDKALGTLRERTGLRLVSEEESWQLRARLLRTARSQAAAVESGALVKVSGRVVARARPLAAPISGRPCVLYVVEAGEGFRDPGPLALKAPWSSLPLETRAAEFAVDDGSGTVLVQPAGAEACLQFRDGDWRLEAAAAHRDFLAARGRASPPFDDDPRGRPRLLHFRETTLGDGDRVTVLGVAAREADPVPDAPSVPYRGTPQRCVFRATKSPLLIVQTARGG
jgi:hypothetical protein